jgi:hypothetical protein
MSDAVTTPRFSLAIGAPSVTSVNSSGVTLAVPNLATTTPAARLAIRAASDIGKPALRQPANVAITVSPAPVTSNTSCALAAKCCGATPD